MALQLRSHTFLMFHNPTEYTHSSLYVMLPPLLAPDAFLCICLGICYRGLPSQTLWARLSQRPLRVIFFNQQFYIKTLCSISKEIMQGTFIHLELIFHLSLFILFFTGQKKIIYSNIVQIYLNYLINLTFRKQPSKAIQFYCREAV